MSLECWQEIINDYERLLENDEGYDVIIYAGENEMSQYFRTAFSNEWAKKKDGKFILEKPNISPDTFKIILRFIYCGRVDLTKLEGTELLKLLIAVDELSIQSLTSHIEKYLIKHQYEFLQQNPMGILEIIYQNESLSNLWNFCLEKICEEPEILFNSDKFINLKAPLLELILERDDLCLEEIFIWECLIKTISKDSTKWSKEEIAIMERTLHRYIPLVRFYYISSEDYHDKVYPFKKVLPKDLVNSLFTFYLVPNRKSNIDKQLPRKSGRAACDSILIGCQHLALFASWIDKKSDLYYNSRNFPYNFNLLYRVSRDGNTITKFHEKTDNKGANIFIAKIKGTNQMIGGYNPLDWEGPSGFKNTADSFILMFNDYKNINIGKIGRVIDTMYAVYGSNHLGPVFGQELNGSCDIMLRENGKFTSYLNSYPDINIPRRFEIEDYEVFQVVKKDLKALI